MPKIREIITLEVVRDAEDDALHTWNWTELIGADAEVILDPSVFVTGNPSNGFEFVGPVAFAAGVERGDVAEGDWWVIPLCGVAPVEMDDEPDDDEPSADAMQRQYDRATGADGSRDHFTNTPEDAAAYERWRGGDDYDPSDDRPEASDLADPEGGEQ
jgi:hypothetical protein